ncbi:MAG: tetratricopeptide repeat protein [Candidatus Acidiferrales bacterium]
MKRRFLCGLVLVFAAAGSVCAQEAPLDPTPLSKADIFGRLAAGASRSYLAHLVKARGIDFSADDDFYAAIERVGGEGVLLDTLHATQDGDGDTSEGVGGDVVQHLANCAEQQNKGDLANAESECRAAMSADPKSAFAVLGTAQCLKMQMRDNEILPLAQQAVQLGPDLSEAHYALAMARSLDQGQATQELQEAKRLEPDELDFRTMFNAYLRDPNVLPSEPVTATNYTRLMNEAREKQSREILQFEPDFAPAHADLADVLIQENRGEEALQEIAEAVQLEPKVGALRQKMAWIASRTNHEDITIAAWREAVRNSPSNATFHDWLASLLWKQQDLDGAAAEYRECLRLDPSDRECAASVVGLLEQRGDFGGAVAEYHRELALAPDSSEVRLNLARELINQGDAKDAFAECQEVLREVTIAARDEDKEANAFIAAQAHEQLGQLLMAEGSASDAVGEYRAALAANPDNTWLHYGLGEALDKDGESAQAEREFSKILKDNPDDFTANNEMAWFYATAADRKYRNPAAALELAKKAVQLSGGEQGYVLDTLAEADYVNGKLDESLATERKAVALDPKNASLQVQFTKFRVADVAASFRMLPKPW